MVVACMVTWVGVALPAGVRFAICATLVLVGVRAIRRFAWLRGSRAVRALDWSGSSWRLELGHKRRSVAAALIDDGIRAGAWYILRFRSVEGTHPVYLDGRCQDDRAFRRLCRRLRVTPPEVVRARSSR
jgi:hypothetical protein